MRKRMDMNSRARQFLPFDAMKGLQEALRAAEFENESVQHHHLSEDEARRISSVLSSLGKSSKVYVKYFADHHYYEISGEAKLDPYGALLLIDDLSIPIMDIYDLKFADQ